MVTNARETSILLYTVRNLGFSLEYINRESKQTVSVELDLHVRHKPTVNFTPRFS
jgi:hypothetical protein